MTMTVTVTDERRQRVEALTHLRGAIMHIEHSMVIDSSTWGYEDLVQLRTARDLVRDLVKDLDTA